MEVGCLGPLEVRDAGRLVPVPGQRLRRALGHPQLVEQPAPVWSRTAW